MKNNAAPFLAPTLHPERDTVALIAPAFAPKIEREQQIRFLKETLGFATVLEYLDWDEKSFFPFANSIEKSSVYFQEALLNPEIKAIFLCRGGFGTALLSLQSAIAQSTPKWIIGFSDLTAIFPLLASKHQVIHGPVVEQFLKNPSMGKEKEVLMALLSKHQFEVRGKSENYIAGECSGYLRGGNLTVLCHNLGTSLEIPFQDTLLFLEDVNEPMYKVHRMLNHLGRVMKNKGSAIESKAFSGLLIGELSSDAPANYPLNIRELCMDNLNAKNFSIPAIFDFPISHGSRNIPLPYNAFVHLKVHNNGEWHLQLSKENSVL